MTTILMTSALPAWKQSSLLRLLTVDISSLRRGWAGSWDPHLRIQPLLPASCVQFCPTVRWPQGVWSTEAGKYQGGVLHLCGCGKALMHAGGRLSHGGCLGVTYTSVSNPSPVLWKTHWSPGWTLVIRTLEGGSRQCLAPPALPREIFHN